MDVPEALANEVENATPAQVPEIGITWAVQQCEALLAADAPCLHFYVMQHSLHVRRVVERLQRVIC